MALIIGHRGVQRLYTIHVFLLSKNIPMDYIVHIIIITLSQAAAAPLHLAYFWVH